jgi:hypothetical protein
VTNQGNVLATGFMDMELWGHGLPPGQATSVARELSTLENQFIYLLPDASAWFYFWVTIPQDLPAASYGLTAVIDTNTEIDETGSGGDANNYVDRADVFALQNPDLTVNIGQVYYLPEDLQPGHRGFVRLDVTNVGPGRAQGYVDLSLALRENAGSDTYAESLLNNQFIYLLPGATSSYYVWLTVPADLPLGDYRLQATVDISSEMAETNEENNTALGGQVYSFAPALPELRVSPGFMFLPRLIIRQNGAALPVSVYNDGTVAAQNTFRVAIYFAPRGQQVVATDAGKLAELTLPGLAAGQVYEGTFNLSFPPTTPLGEYDLRAFVDVGNTVAEINEDNWSSTYWIILDN